ncbi:MAG: arsenic resistance N-acetyltransferase ArsN2 [Acidiferrobacterales bacterium]|nr:arsenic resistance N-acetyltransferase ArsN2 [Acidiferrobacterales bacterium]
MHYRFASADDETIINRLLADAHLPHDDVAPHLHNFILAIENEAIIGIIGLEVYGQIGLLRSLVVVPAMRGRGLSQDLCERLFRYARAQGVRELYLLTLDAEAYFQARGFRHIERASAPDAIQGTRQFEHLCPTSATLMFRDLHARSGATAWPSSSARRK